MASSAIKKKKFFLRYHTIIAAHITLIKHTLKHELIKIQSRYSLFR